MSKRPLGKKATLVVDASLLECGVLSVENISRRSGFTFNDVVPVFGNDPEELRRLVHLGPQMMVAVGGGSTLDIVKLAGWAQRRPPEILDRLLDSKSPPYEILSSGRRRVPVWAAATTFGTGAEDNDKASLRIGPHILRMFRSPELKPSRGIVLPSLLSNLPRNMIDQGLAEVVFRLLGPALESRSTVRDGWLADRFVELSGIAAGIPYDDDSDASSRRGRMLASVAAIGRELHQPGAFDVASQYVGLPWFLGRTVQEQYPQVSKIDAVWDSWIRLAMAYEQYGSRNDYTMRWAQLRQQLVARGMDPSVSLVHFLFTLKKRFHVGFDGYLCDPCAIDEVPSICAKRWSGFIDINPGLLARLEATYQGPFDDRALNK